MESLSSRFSAKSNVSTAKGWTASRITPPSTLFGANGSGKSTLISLLAGLALPSAGQVLIGDQDISRMDETARARMRAQRIGLVFQSGNLIPFLSALENVRMAAFLSDDVESIACSTVWPSLPYSSDPSALQARDQSSDPA